MELRGVSKAYGHTVAANDVSLVINAGEMVAIAGHNGAGKSTTAKIIGGIVQKDEGTILVDGRPLPEPNSVKTARQHGIALAFQEITLFADLQVFEHGGVADQIAVRRGWRSQAVETIQSQLDDMFPSHGISPYSLVSSLSLAQRQMLQVALATLRQDDIKLLILDEPTSSLSDDLAGELFDYLHRQRKRQGLSVILVSHKMTDILNHCDRSIVMRDGAVVSDRPLSDVAVEQMMVDMGATPATQPADAKCGERSAKSVASVTYIGDGKTSQRKPVLAVDELEWGGLDKVSLSVGKGEIVGLAGLEANGQQEILEAVWRARTRFSSSKIRSSVSIDGTVAYVSGDRQKEGIFPLWSVSRNITIGNLGEISSGGLISPNLERAATKRWIDQMSIKAGPDDLILSLSGGNQQKVLLGRGLSQAPQLLILDDPFRGVDIGSKTEAYRQLRDVADSGAAILWFTSENSELLECDRVYVLRGGAISAELKADQLNAEQIILNSFSDSSNGAGVEG